jgi:hypothetical protein
VRWDCAIVLLNVWFVTLYWFLVDVHAYGVYALLHADASFDFYLQFVLRATLLGNIIFSVLDQPVVVLQTYNHCLITFVPFFSFVQIFGDEQQHLPLIR